MSSSLGRPRRFRTPEDRQAVITYMAKGHSLRQAARKFGAAVGTIVALVASEKEAIRSMADRLQVAAADKILESDCEVLEKLAETARTVGDRSQPQAARVLGEYAGVIGGKGGVNVHVGDNIVNAAVLVGNVADLPPEQLAALEEQKRRWGMA